MRRGLGLILALGLGGAAIYGIHNASTSTPAAVYQQQQQVQPTTSTAPTPASATSTPAQPPSQTTTLSNDNHYANSDGNSVHAPAYSSNGVPAGATAVCRDGTYSFSLHHQGTCSHHGGVAQWL